MMTDAFFLPMFNKQLRDEQILRKAPSPLARFTVPNFFLPPRLTPPQAPFDRPKSQLK